MNPFRERRARIEAARIEILKDKKYEGSLNLWSMVENVFEHL